MSASKLLNSIRVVSMALQNARDVADQNLIETLEDELYELEQELESSSSNTRHEWID